MKAAPLFSSRRERRLWIYTISAVLAIYATLGLASMLAGALTDGQAAVGFIVGVLLVGLTVLTQGLQVRPRGAEVAVALGVAVVYGFALFRMTLAERSHIIEYGVVAVFVYEALVERRRNGRRVRWPAVLAVAATALVGVVDEAVQAVLPSRVFDPADMLFNALAALMAVSASGVLAAVRKRSRSRLRVG